jgi:predicted pyridoxine 5'-phosphate oxidase superfamily flavin-nucleotide-binding protein
MRKMTRDMKEMLETQVSYLATATPNGKPNVVPVGFVKAIGDSEILIVDVSFNKTRKNLRTNANASIAVTDFARMQAYQFKGKVEIMKSGPLFEQAYEVIRNKYKEQENWIERGLQDVELKKKYRQMAEKGRKFRPSAAVLLHVETIYSTWQM